MKYKTYLITALFSIFFACDENMDELIIANETLIAGTWELTEAHISAGGPQYWIDIENGEEIEFFENGTFTSNRYLECTQGSFSIDENNLSLKYECDDFSSDSENEDGFITYNLKFYSHYFILTRTSGAICIEGCSSKYQSIK
ncbi:hypothetical protein APS56_00495 [Pseudalgibacter alginicilyticus]|uniref:Lipocalin-like domain-containing protein n=1 Tax=Pseudalgibacter alginicilyticus TaxID=1736674 RepID=A0A0P0CCZ4_9FLAO|nr:lipocalin family protein [Pseudalgibacter alginicilyticus]ALJ03719.1 hypothetical protein APS56_00495 [Pseudalgibacter alginicilyticus]